MNLKPDNALTPQDVFTSYKEFTAYFRETIGEIKEDKKQDGKGVPLSQFIPNVIDIEYVKDLKKTRISLPRYAGAIVIQLPEDRSQTIEDKKCDFQLYLSVVKIMEADFGIKLSMIKKLFDSKKREKTEIEPIKT